MGNCNGRLDEYVFKEIINSEVAMAFLTGSLVNKIRAGIIRKPPPAPTKPVTMPIKNPSIKMMRYFKPTVRVYGATSFFCLSIKKAAVNMSNPKKIIIPDSFKIEYVPILNSRSGNIGIKNLRERKTPINDGTENRKPILKSTNFLKLLFIVPKVDETPTINKE